MSCLTMGLSKFVILCFLQVCLSQHKSYVLNLSVWQLPHENATILYFTGDNTADWHSAQSICRAEGGHLISIHTDEDNNIIRSLLNTSDLTQVWLGLYRPAGSLNFTWVNGSEVTYNNWMDAEPNRSNNQSACVYLNTNDFKWRDDGCIYEHSFICTKDRASATVVMQVQTQLRGGSTSNEGYVEVYYNGRWGRICDDSWGLEDAMVICRQLFLGSPIRATVGSEFYTGSSSNFLMDDVACTGSETNIGYCPFDGWGVHNCDSNDVAGVVCEGTVAVDAQLVGGSNSNEGYVEVLYGGIWGRICDDLWSLNDATVICRQLGLGSAVRFTYGSEFYTGSNSNFHMDDVACTGSETNIGYCPFGGWGVHNCDSSDVAGVVCGSSSASSDASSVYVFLPFIIQMLV